MDQLANTDLIELDGLVVKSIRGGKYEVEVKSGDEVVISTCHLGGKLRMN